MPARRWGFVNSMMVIVLDDDQKGYHDESSTTQFHTFFVSWVHTMKLGVNVDLVMLVSSQLSLPDTSAYVPLAI